MTNQHKLDLALAAEIDKLGADITLSDDAKAALAGVEARNINSLRQLTQKAIFDDRRANIRKLAGLASLLPSGYLAGLAKNALGPVFAGRVVGAMHAVTASKIAKRLDAAFLAETAAQAEPSKVREIIKLIPADLIKDVALLLVEKQDYILMGRFADALSAPAIRLVVKAVADDAVLLNIAYYMEDPSQLSKVVMMIDNDRVASIMRTGTERDLWPQALSIIDNVSPELQGRLANIMGEQDEATLDNLVAVADEKHLWGPVLRGMAAMNPKHYRKIVNLPSLKNKELLGRLVNDAHDDGLLATALPLAKVMQAEFQKVVANAALDQGDDVAEAALWAAHNSGRWDVILDLAQHLGDDQRDILARLPIAQNRQVLEALLRSAADSGHMPLLLDFAKRFNPAGLHMVVEIGLQDSGDLLEKILEAAHKTKNGWDAVVIALAAVEDEGLLQNVGLVYRRQEGVIKKAFQKAAENHGIWERVAPMLEAA